MSPDTSKPSTVVAQQARFSEILSGTRTADSTELKRRKVHIIAQSGVPRWLLPQDPRCALPVLRSWRPYARSSRMKWQIVLRACQAGMLDLLPGTSAVELPYDLSYWHQWLPEFSDKWSQVAYIGNPSPTHKAVVFFVNGTGQVRAVAKAPLTAAARIAILNEARMLVVMRRRLCVPDVLFADTTAGIAAQSWVAGNYVSRDFTEDHLALLLQLAEGDGMTQLSDRRHEIEERLQDCQMALDRELLARAVAVLEVPGSIRTVIEHRDFLPWNLKRLASGRLAVIDWEWAAEGALPWQDICRFFYLQDYLFQTSSDVWNTLSNHPLLARYCDKLALTRGIVRALTMHYLLRSLFEDCAEAQHTRAAYTVQSIRRLLQSR